MPVDHRFIPLSHHPVGLKEDRLGRTPYAETIYQILKDIEPQNSGLTIGIFGDWGSGKSSILKMTHEIIEKDTDFLPVWFEAWRFTKQEELWLALLREIVKEITAKQGFWSLLCVNVKLFAGNLTFRDGLGILLDLLGFVVSSLFGRLNISLPPGPEASFLLQLGFDRGQSIAVREFRNDLQIVLRSINKRVVVLIDDLDRCPNNEVIPVLEAIKHLGFDEPLTKPKSLEQWFNSKYYEYRYRFLRFLRLMGIDVRAIPYDEPKEFLIGLTFVLAADRRAILQAVRVHYKDYYQLDERKTEEFSREYLEKIVQLPFVLPPLRRTQLEPLLEGDVGA